MFFILCHLKCQKVMAHKQQMAATSQAGDTTLLSQLAPSSSSSSPSSSQEKPYIYSQARVEDVTPVNAKLRAKALRPPVTIKNFFKPKAGASTDDTDGLSQSWASTQLQTVSPLPKTSQKTFTKEDGRLKPAQSDLEKEGDDCVVIGKSQESKSSKESDKDVAESCSPEQSIEETEKENHSQRKTRSKKEETSEGKTEQKKETTKRAKKTEASDDDDDDSYVPETRRGTKRKSSQMLTKAKTKQSRTAPTATTKSDSKGKEEKEKRCPICDKKFDPGTWNEEINAHIDNCLIE